MCKVVLLSLLSLYCLAGLSPVDAGERIVLRCADVQTLGYPTVEGVQYMSRLVKEQTDGRITIVVYPSSKLGSEDSVLEMVRMGMLELGRISTATVAKIDPQFGVFALPYLFKDNRHKWKVLDGPIGAGMLNDLSRVELIGLCFQEAGYRSFYNSQHPIYRPEDLKGLKIRIQPNDMMVRFLEFLGGYPVPMNYDEIGPALNAKVIDGAENNIPSFFSSGHYQDAVYYSFDRHAAIPDSLIMSRKTWARLKRADRQIIMSAARKSVTFQRRRWNEFESRCLEQLLRAGCQTNEVDLKSFRLVSTAFNRRYGRTYAILLKRISNAETQE